MLFQSAIDKFTAETAFRCVVNANTATLTITAGSIAINSPVVLATATASLPGVNTGSTLPGTIINNFVQRPATATSLVNNLFAGILARVPGTKAYLDREEAGLAQIYGPLIGAIVKRPLSNIGGVGCIMIPDSDQSMLPSPGPMTIDPTTATALGVEVPALGGLAVNMQAIASSSATETTTSILFLRCG